MDGQIRDGLGMGALKEKIFPSSDFEKVRKKIPDAAFVIPYDLNQRMVLLNGKTSDPIRPLLKISATSATISGYLSATLFDSPMSCSRL
jgi:hypothetical protein